MDVVLKYKSTHTRFETQILTVTHVFVQTIYTDHIT